MPVVHSAIVMSAAQDDQRAKETVDESGNHHGLFSSALLRVLCTEPVDQTALNVQKGVSGSGGRVSSKSIEFGGNCLPRSREVLIAR